MTDAREIIASIRYKPISMATVALGEPGAEAILAALTAAGFRILGPGLLRDIEYVVEIANRNEASPEGFRLAAALRALKEKQG